MTEAEWNVCADPTPMLKLLRGKASDRKLRLFAVACCRHAGWLLEMAAGVSEGRYENAVATAERFADGAAGPEQLAAAKDGADDLVFCHNDLEGVGLDELIRAQLGDDDARLPARCRARESWSDRGRWPQAEYEPWLAAVKEAAAAGGWCWSVDPFRDVAGEDAAMVGETVWRQVLLLARQLRGPAGEREERAAQAAIVHDLFGGPDGPPASDPSWRTAAVVEPAQSIYDARAFARLPLLADALEEAGCADAAILAHCREPREHVRGCWVVDLLLGKE